MSRAKTLDGVLGNLRFILGYKTWAALLLLAGGVVLGAALAPAWDDAGLAKWLLGAIGATVIGALGHFGQAFIAKYVNQLRKRRAYARLQQEPHYRVGARIHHVVDPGSGSWIFRDCEIAEMGVGRVLLRQLGTGLVIPMTCMEFEALHVVIETRTQQEDD